METIQKNFEQQLAFGKEGEHEVAKWFIDRHYSALTLYQFENITEAPKIFTSKKALLSPDLFVSKPGKCFWAEVKTKNRWIEYGTSETGCNHYHYLQYKNVMENTGIPLYLVFNHKEQSPLGYYFISIDVPPSRIWDGFNVKTRERVSKPLALWRIDQLHKLEDKQDVKLTPVQLTMFNRTV